MEPALRTILMPLGGLVGASVALDAAMRVAKRFEAQVEVLHVYEIPRRYSAGWDERPTAAFVDEVAAAQRAANDRMAAARAQFDEACAAHGVPIVEQSQTSGCAAHFSIITGQEKEVSATFGRLSDLIVAATPEDSDDPSHHETVQALLMETGRPVLIVPHGGVASIGSSIAIAWNGRTESSRVIHFALPFLWTAKRVVVLEVEGAGRKRGLGSDAVVRYLAQHGVEALSENVERNGRTIGESLLAAENSMETDLLIMGGNAQTRLRHLIFGTVTKDVLTGATFPVLLAH
jgi:nucleotide-binding universal stress UspA family protein